MVKSCLVMKLISIHLIIHLTNLKCQCGQDIKYQFLQTLVTITILEKDSMLQKVQLKALAKLTVKTSHNNNSIASNIACLLNLNHRKNWYIELKIRKMLVTIINNQMWNRSFKLHQNSKQSWIMKCVNNLQWC